EVETDAASGEQDQAVDPLQARGRDARREVKQGVVVAQELGRKLWHVLAHELPLDAGDPLQGAEIGGGREDEGAIPASEVSREPDSDALRQHKTREWIRRLDKKRTYRIPSAIFIFRIGGGRS